MPVVGISVKLLTERLQSPLGREELIQELQHLGCDVEGYTSLRRYKCLRCGNIVDLTMTQDPPVLCKRCGLNYRECPGELEDLGTSEVIRMELLAVRPDMFDPGGLARTLRGYLGQQDSPPRYTLHPPVARVGVDPLLLGQQCPRPAIACAVVRGIHLDDDIIKVLMNLQENLHWALGRDRKHASIGVYDLSTLAWPEFAYRAVEPEEVRFTALGFDTASRESAMTPREILEHHPKGVEFRRLLDGFSRYPLLTDARGNVLSMPPIINSEATRVTDDTDSFFIDVTGTNRRLVGRTLNVFVTSLVELEPGIIVEQVHIDYPQQTLITPDFTDQQVRLGVTDTSELLGIPLDTEQLERLLARMGHTSVVESPDSLLVKVPAYRNDIMHPRDLMEDVAIAFGYHNISPRLVPTMTIGGELEIEKISRVARQALCGLGFLEVMTLVLTSERAAFHALGLVPGEDHVSLKNPISKDQTILRPSLLAGLLETLTINAHREYPQRIFEIGDVSGLVDSDTGAIESRYVAGAVIGEGMGVTQVRAAAEAVLREFAWSIRTVAMEFPAFLPGRGASVVACRGQQEKQVGILGELHPATLEHFKLRHSTGLFEIDLHTLIMEP